ncbi:hypothetical protein CW304_27640 [Bacillus sp. UFRGS-B20]|nr:hypothetical protein CW304_27640 [Bacillus sp. UFRGS-B20]
MHYTQKNKCMFKNINRKKTDNHFIIEQQKNDYRTTDFKRKIKPRSKPYKKILNTKKRKNATAEVAEYKKLWNELNRLLEDIKIFSANSW